MSTSEKLLTCDSCRLLYPLHALCSGVETLALACSLLRDPLPVFPAGVGGLQARPRDPGPRQLDQVSDVLAGRRVQTPDEAGNGGCRGNLASGPGRELGVRGKRAGIACRIQQAPLRAPPPPSSRVTGSSCFSCRVDSWLLGQQGSSWVATPISLPSFDLLGRGQGLFLVS